MVKEKLDNAWLINLLKSVNSGASPDSIFRLFASDVSASIGVKSIQVFYFDRSGDLQLKHWYGLQEHQIADSHILKMSFSNPATDCCKNKKVLVLDSPKEITDRYPDSLKWDFMPGSLISFPLLIGNVVEGVMVYTFNQPLDQSQLDLSEELEELQVLAELCQLLTHRLPFNKITTPSASSSATNLASHQTVDLGERHHKMLCYLAKGFTNREIAHAMNYSEATTRVELGKLFTKMGVNNRQEAAALAHKYGCL